MGRFLNADNLASTGQGILGNNMFTYCGNSPITRHDTEGNSWATVGIGVAVAGITGLANGYSSYTSGGDFWPAFWIGVGAGGVGYVLSLTTKNPLLLVGIRSITSLGSNFLTTAANNGTVNTEAWLVSAWDAVMDGVFSMFTYFYNPFPSVFFADTYNAIIDGFTDIAETWLYYSSTDKTIHCPQSIPTPTIRRSSRKRPQNYVTFEDRKLLY